MNIALVIVPVIGMFAVFTTASMMSTRRKLGALQRRAKEARRLHQVGAVAVGRVLALRMGSMVMTIDAHRHLELTIDVEVHPMGRPPYVASQTTLLSELHVPSLQPGATVQVRIDPANPVNVAVAAVGPSSMLSGPRPVASAWGACPTVLPIVPPLVPGGVGAIIGFATVAMLVSMAFVAWFAMGGQTAVGPTHGGTPRAAAPADPDSVCGRAVRCCRAVAAGSTTHCDALGNGAVPESACQSTLEGFERAAQATGRSCG